MTQVMTVQCYISFEMSLVGSLGNTLEIPPVLNMGRVRLECFGQLHWLHHLHRYDEKLSTTKTWQTGWDANDRLTTNQQIV